jgi:hypothetical protein
MSSVPRASSISQSGPIVDDDVVPCSAYGPTPIPPHTHSVGMEMKRVPRASSILAQSSMMMWCTSVSAGSASARTPMWMVKKEGLFL